MYRLRGEEMTSKNLEYSSVHMQWKDPAQAVAVFPFVDGWEEKLNTLKTKLTPERFAEFRACVLEYRRREGFSK